MPQIKPYVAGGVEYLDPAEHPPPLGAKILLLTPGHVCCIGHWNEWFIAWHPLPTIPKHIKEQRWSAANAEQEQK